MPGHPTPVTWTVRSSAPTGVDALGAQQFGETPLAVSGTFYPDRRSAPTSGTTPGFLVEYDAVLISDTFTTGKEGDHVTVEGTLFVCAGAEVFTLPFAPGRSHAEYTLKALGPKGAV